MLKKIKFPLLLKRKKKKKRSHCQLHHVHISGPILTFGRRNLIFQQTLWPGCMVDISMSHPWDKVYQQFQYFLGNCVFIQTSLHPDYFVPTYCVSCSWDAKPKQECVEKQEGQCKQTDSLHPSLLPTSLLLQHIQDSAHRQTVNIFPLHILFFTSSSKGVFVQSGTKQPPTLPPH